MQTDMGLVVLGVIVGVAGAVLVMQWLRDDLGEAVRRAEAEQWPIDRPVLTTAEVNRSQELKERLAK